MKRTMAFPNPACCEPYSNNGSRLGYIQICYHAARLFFFYVFHSTLLCLWLTFIVQVSCAHSLPGLLWRHRAPDAHCCPMQARKGGSGSTNVIRAAKNLGSKDPDKSDVHHKGMKHNGLTVHKQRQLSKHPLPPSSPAHDWLERPVTFTSL